jgi:hypothetical protein
MLKRVSRAQPVGFPLSYNEPMRSFRGKLRLVRRLLTAYLMLGCLSVVPTGITQTQEPSQIPNPLGQTQRVPFGQQQQQDPDPMARHAQDEAAKQRNTDRQTRLVADTNKLLLLAQELKTEVDKSNKDQLSLTVVKKADEIEKLAKSVKERMKAE